MNQVSTAPQTRWRYDEKPQLSKPLIVSVLSLLLIVCIVLCIVYLWPKPRPRVVGFAFAVDGSSSETRVPQPAFVRWAPPMKNWQPWLADSEPQPYVITEENGLKGLSQQIKAKFAFAKGTKHDTLVLYIRGLALGIPSGESDSPSGKEPGGENRLYLLSPENANPMKDKRHRIALDDALKELQTIEAAHIVVLADIGDLAALPQLGITGDESSDVATLLGQAVGKLESGGNRSKATPLWLITSRGPLQPNHVSYLLEKTLLQAAVEHALSAKSSAIATTGATQSPYLSLSSFYEHILRYSFTVSADTQTPLLFRSGNAKRVDDGSDAEWKEAKEVQVAFQSNDRSEESPTETAPPNNETNDSQQANHQGIVPGARGRSIAPGRSTGWHFVAMPRLQSPNGEAVGRDTQGSQATAPEQPSSTTPSRKPEEVDPDSFLRFWQLRDRLSSRKAEGDWSPADFAADRWQFLQRDILRWDRIQKLKPQSEDESSARINAYKIELENAIHEIGTESNRSSLSNNPLSRQWISLRSKVHDTTSPLIGWSSAERLADDRQDNLRDIWEESRQQLRELIDASSEIAAWLELCLKPDIKEFEELRQDVFELADALNDGKLELVRKSSSGLIGADRRPLQFKNMKGIHNRVQQNFNRFVETTLSKVATVSDDQTPQRPRQITWGDERVIQLLLSSPLLSYEQRKTLSKDYYPGSKSLALNLPGDDNRPFASGTLAPMLAKASYRAFDSQLWLDRVESLVQNALGGTPTSVDGWFRACFYDTWNQDELNGGMLDSSGVILPVVQDGRLYVRLDKKIKTLDQAFQIRVLHRDGTSVKRCRVAWEPRYGGSSSHLLLVDRVTPISPSDPLTSISVQRDVFQVSLDVSGSDSLDEFPIEINVFHENESSAPSLKETVTFRRDSDHVDLFAQRYDYEADRWRQTEPQKAAVPVNDRRDLGDELVLSDFIRAPAIAYCAQSEYMFSLQNGSTRDTRTFNVSLYAAVSDEDSANGQITRRAIELTKARFRSKRDREEFGKTHLIAKAEGNSGPPSTDAPIGNLPPVRLEKLDESVGASAGIGVSQGTRVQLRPVQEEPPLLGQNGLVLVLEETDDAGNIKTESDLRYYWIDCISDNPHSLGRPESWLVDVSPQRRQGSDWDTEFSFKIQPEIWKRWNVPVDAELPIAMALSDENGQAIKNLDVRFKDVLNEKRDQVTLHARPKFDGPLPNRVVVHVDIGGYPRACAFRYNGNRSGQIERAYREFLWLDPSSTTMDVTVAGEKPQEPLIHPVDGIRPQFLVRNTVGANAKDIGTPVQVHQLTIPFGLDFPEDDSNSTASHAIVNLGTLRKPKNLKHDRHFEPKIEIDSKEGTLIFSSSTRDHTYSDVVSDLKGRQEFRVETTVGSRTSDKSIVLIFDKEPPDDRTKISVSPTSWFDNEPLKIELDASDALTGIDQVLFAINVDRGDEIKYDRGDWILVEYPANRPRSGNTWWLPLNAEDFTTFVATQRRPKLEVGESFVIVARSIDKAGNVQDNYRPASFTWMGPRPTPPKAPAKPETLPAEPKPKTHKVTLTVTFHGKSNLSKLSADGPGKQSIAKNVITFREVPEGPQKFTVTAGTTIHSGSSSVDVHVTGDVAKTVDVKVETPKP